MTTPPTLELDLATAQQALTNFGKHQVPLIGYCNPQLVSLSDQHCEVTIPLNSSTQNHLQCLYFGTLAVGADITGGFLAMTMINTLQQPIELLFKDFKADFHRRAEGDTHFHCHDGRVIQQMIKQTMETGQRVNQALTVTATVPTINAETPVATFQLTLSLRYKPT